MDMWESPEPSRIETKACFEAKAKREENLNTVIKKFQPDQVKVEITEVKSEVKEVKKLKKKRVSTVKKILGKSEVEEDIKEQTTKGEMIKKKALPTPKQGCSLQYQNHYSFQPGGPGRASGQAPGNCSQRSQFTRRFAVSLRPHGLCCQGPHKHQRCQLQKRANQW